MVRFAQRALRYTLLLAGIVLILLALLSAVVRVALPMAAGYKSEIESRVSDYIKSPVTIGELEAQWHGFGPQLHAADVLVIQSADRQVALDKLVIDLNMFKSVWHGSPVINDLTLIGADLSIEYAGDGAMRIQGATGRKSATSNEGSRSLDSLSWLLNAGHINLQDARITFIDAKQKELRIEDFNLLARNRDGEHFLRVDMQLPAELGGKVSIGVDLSQSIKRFSDASGKIHVKADQLQFAGWRSLRSSALKRFGEVSNGFARLDGTVDVELWGTLESGQLDAARGQITASNITDVRNGDTVLDRIGTDVTYTNRPAGWVLQSDEAELQYGDEISVIDSVEFAYEPAPDIDWKLSSSSNEIPLALALRLPAMLLSTEAGVSRRDWLIDAAPSGVMHRFDSEFSMYKGDADISVNGSFYDVSLEAANGLPGVENLTGSLDISHNQGAVTLLAKSMQLDYPKALHQVVSIDDLQSEFNIDFKKIAEPTVEGTTKIATHGMQLELRHKLHAKKGQSPHVDVIGQYQAADIGQLRDLLPTRQMTKSAQAWFKNAFKSGQIDNGSVILFGDLADFPFDEDEGVFKAGFDYSDVRMKFLGTWPAVENGNGRVELSGFSLKSTTTSGTMDGMKLVSAVARIADLKNPYLELESSTTGKLKQMIDFANSGPLASLLRPALANTSGTGAARVDVALELPLKLKRNEFGKPIGRLVDDLKLNGNVFLKGNSFSLPTADVTANSITGAVGFNERGVRISNLNALYLDQVVRVSTDNKSKPGQRATQIRLTGALRAGDVLSHYDLPMAEYIEGVSKWDVILDLAGVRKNPTAGIELIAKSDLVGTRMRLPKPMEKFTSRSMPITLRSMLGGASSSSEWYVNAGKLGSSRIVSNSDGLQSLAINLGGGKLNRNLKEGIRIDGATTELAVDGWIEKIAEVIDNLPESDEQNEIMPISVDLVTPSLVAGVESLGAAQLRVNTDKNYINVVVDNPAIQGNLRYPRDHWTKTKPMKVRIAYAEMRVIDALGSAPDKGDEKNRLDPRELPPVEMRVSQFVWGDLNLRNVTLRGTPDHSGMQIDTLGFATGTTQLIGSGYWRVKDPQSVNPQLSGAQHTRLNLTLQSDDFGDGLRFMGLDRIMDEGQGRITAAITWPDALYSPEIENINGTMNFDLERGRIIKIDPGAARLVGLFALQAIPRRLSLDFKDLVEDGLDFDTVAGQVEVANGIGNVSSIQLNGAVGVIEVTGETNLLTQNFDQTITVLPRVSSALPLLGAISGGASGGLTVLLAGGVLKAIGIDFDRLGLREYTLTGTFDNPKIEQSAYDPVRGY